MKVKNEDIQSLLDKANSVKSLLLDGKTVLSIIEFKNLLLNQDKVNIEAQTHVIESMCSKNSDGTPKSKSHNLPDGRVGIAYVFDDPEIELKCKSEIVKMSSLENDFPLNPSNIKREDIERMTLSVDQCQFLLLFVAE